MPTSCKTVSYEPLPLIPAGEPVPDYSQLLNNINGYLAAIDTLLGAQRAQDKELYPQPGDEDNYIGDTQNCTANAVTTITWAFLPDYTYYFKKIYVDKQAGMSYIWTFQSTTEATGAKVLNGNEHDFNGKLVKGRGNTTLKLAMTNSGATAMEHDIVIQSWARRVT